MNSIINKNDEAKSVQLIINELTKHLVLESNNTLSKDIAKKIAYDVVNGLDLSDPYVLHSSIRQRAKDILPKIKKEYLEEKK